MRCLYIAAILNFIVFVGWLVGWVFGSFVGSFAGYIYTNVGLNLSLNSIHKIKRCTLDDQSSNLTQSPKGFTELVLNATYALN